MPYVDNKGVHVYYEIHGSGTAIVFLHPFSTNGYIWYFQTFTFAPRHRCVVIDGRGHGRSDKPRAGYAIEEMALDLTLALDASGVDRAILVGNSIGGMIALQFNLDHPNRVLGNVIISSVTAFGATMAPEGLAPYQDNLEENFLRTLENSVSKRTKRERPEILELLKAQATTDSNFPGYVRQAAFQDAKGLFNWDIRQRLQEIRVPTVVFAGAEDDARVVRMNEALAENIPRAQFHVVQDVGHYYELEAPAAFNRQLTQFVRGL